MKYPPWIKVERLLRMGRAQGGPVGHGEAGDTHDHGARPGLGFASACARSTRRYGMLALVASR